MTNKRSEEIGNFSGKKKVVTLTDKDAKLREAGEQELLEMPDLKPKNWKTMWAAANQQQVFEGRKMEDRGPYLVDHGKLDEGTEEKILVGGSDHLLILAESAELILRSKDGFPNVREDVQSHDGLQPIPVTRQPLKNVKHDPAADKKSIGKQLHELHVIDPMRKEEDGLQYEGGTPRLSQIRCQARSKSNMFVQELTGGCLRGRRTRLTQIRHQARTKSHSRPEEQIENNSCASTPSGTTRLSQLRSLARSRSNSIWGEAINGGGSRPLNGQTSEEHRRREAIIAEIFGEEQSFPEDWQLPEVSGGDGNEMDEGVNQSVSGNEETEESSVSSKGRRRVNHSRHREAQHLKVHQGKTT